MMPQNTLRRYPDQSLSRRVAEFEALLEADAANDAGAVARHCRTLAKHGIELQLVAPFKSENAPAAKKAFRRLLAALLANQPEKADDPRAALDELGIAVDLPAWHVAPTTGPRGAA